MTKTYITKRGDTFLKLAPQFHTTRHELIALNPLVPHPPRLGTTIVVPGHLPAPGQPVAVTPVVVRQAMIKANQNAHWPHGMCDNFCAQMYGFSHSGYGTAVVHWGSIPAGYKHPGATNAPLGALVMFGGGSTGAGHATLSEGAGTGLNTKIRTIDMANGHYSPGDVSTATIAQVLNWGTLHYLGWADPYFSGSLVAKVS